jgi:predicted DCC family thiol-disulfide oxidoreductase YuxK
MWIARWKRATGERIEYAPFQQAAGRVPGLLGVPREAFARAVHLLEPDGRVTRGAEAALRSLARAPGLGWGLWLYRFVPGIALLAEAGYAWVASHRPLCARVTRALGGRDPGE